MFYKAVKLFFEASIMINEMSRGLYIACELGILVVQFSKRWLDGFKWLRCYLMCIYNMFIDFYERKWKQRCQIIVFPFMAWITCFEKHDEIMMEVFRGVQHLEDVTLINVG
jgi:hypothetical protein